MARVIIAAMALALPSLAWADPITLVALAIKTVFVVEGFAALALYVGAGLLRTSAAKRQAKKARAAQISAYNASLQDRTVQFASTEASERYVYGSPAPFAGNIVANFVSGDRDQFRHLVIYLASHECQACDAVYIDGVSIGALDANGWVTGGDFYETASPAQASPEYFSGASITLSNAPIPESVAVYIGDTYGNSQLVPHSLSGSTVTVAAPYDGVHGKTVQYQYSAVNARVRVVMHLSPGGADTADAGLIAAVPAKWTSAHKASDTTYAVITLDLRMARFQGGPPVFTFKMRGKKVYDPRTAVTVYSANPALCAMDYLRTRHGGAVALTNLDATWIAAANACDTAAYTAAANTGNTTELFRCDGVFDLAQGRDGILANFEASCSGEISESAGLWRIRAGVWTPPVITLTDADVFGLPEQLQAGHSLENRFNGARGQYVDAAGLGVPQDAKPYSNAAFLASDGGEPRIADVPLGFIGSEQRARHAMRVRVERSRGGQTLKVQFSPRAWPLQPGDRVIFSYSPFQISGRAFRVVSWSQAQGQGPAIEMERDSESIWDLADSATAYSQPTSDLPSAFMVPALDGLVADSGDAYLRKGGDGGYITGVRLDWTASDNVFIVQGGQVEFQSRSVLDGDAAWQSHPSEPGAFSFTTLFGLQDGLHYLIRARFFNQRRIPGAWSTITHLVLGKTAPPAPFDSVSVLAQPDGTRQFNFAYMPASNKPADWEGCEIYYTADLAATSLAAMTRLQDEQTFYTNSPAETNSPIEGTYRFAFVSRDYSQNLSSPSFVNISLPKRRTGRVFDEYFEHAESWPGALGSMAELYDTPGTTILEATSATTWDALTTWDAWTRWNMAPASPCSYTGAARDLGTVLAGQVDAALDADGAAVLELRTGADGLIWSGWGSISAPFTARWIQVRVTLTATGGEPVPALRKFAYTVTADVKREYINDQIISAYTGGNRIGVGDVRIPLQNAYSVIKRIGVVIQDSRAGAWSWQRVDNTLSGPRIQFKLGGTLTDPAFVDFDIEGI